MTGNLPRSVLQGSLVALLKTLWFLPWWIVSGSVLKFCSMVNFWFRFVEIGNCTNSQKIIRSRKILELTGLELYRDNGNMWFSAGYNRFNIVFNLFWKIQVPANTAVFTFFLSSLSVYIHCVILRPKRFSIGIPVSTLPRVCAFTRATRWNKAMGR